VESAILARDFAPEVDIPIPTGITNGIYIPSLDLPMNMAASWIVTLGRRMDKEVLDNIRFGTGSTNIPDLELWADPRAPAGRGSLFFCTEEIGRNSCSAGAKKVEIRPAARALNPQASPSVCQGASPSNKRGRSDLEKIPSGPPAILNHPQHPVADHSFAGKAHPQDQSGKRGDPEHQPPWPDNPSSFSEDRLYREIMT